jgi:hypothetical protein
MTDQTKNEDIHAYVRQRYGAIAERQEAAPAEAPVSASSCCGPSPNQSTSSSSSCCGGAPADQVGNIQFYDTPDAADLPYEVTGLSLGCGDPITLASLQPGQTVLDLGSGGGIDCFLAAKRVGPSGSVIGVDMTPAMPTGT